MTGDVNGDFVEHINVTVKKGPGSDNINLGNTTVSYLGPDNSQTLTYTAGSATATEFNVTAVRDTDNSLTVLNNGDDRFKVNIALDKVDSAGNGIEESEEAELEFVTRSGAKTLYQFQVPTALEGKSVVKL